MDHKEYFDNAKGYGVLATADSDGKVGMAIYARPHVMNDGTVAFIMTDRLMHHNLQSNPHAAYLFMEEPSEGGRRYAGKRLMLTKVKEEKDTELLRSLRRRTYEEDKQGRYLVFFMVDKTLPLVGTDEKQT